MKYCIVVPKDGDVRICVDLTKLNKSVLWEAHPLPMTDYLLDNLMDQTILANLTVRVLAGKIPGYLDL